VRFYESADFAAIARWHEEQGVIAPARDLLPSVGLVAPGEAAGFLYCTDGGIALLEGLVANPRVGPRARSRALDDVVRGLVDEARKGGFRHALGFTQHRAVAERCVRTGARLIGHRELLVWDV
jgi:hypothetical protein